MNELSIRAPLAGRNAVVTGASSGIGQAIAVELARQGADVFLHARGNRQGLDETACLVASNGRASHAFLADIADAGECAALVQAAFAWRDVDLWVNNAGADVLTGPAAKWSFDQKFDLVWRVDVRGTMRLSREAGQRMIRAAEQSDSRDRAIVNIGWDQALQGMAGDSGEMFAATKGAVMAFSRSLAQSLAPHVRVNAVAPGWIETAWGQTASEAWRTRATREALVGRWGKPQDVAAAVAYLGSDAARFVTGQVMPVNGGFRYGQA